MVVGWDLEDSLVRAGAHLLTVDLVCVCLLLYQDTVECQDQEDRVSALKKPRFREEEAWTHETIMRVKDREVGKQLSQELWPSLFK